MQDSGYISGLIDLVNAVGTTAKFRGRMFIASQSLSAGEIDNAGRTDGDFPEQVYTFSSGLFKIEGVADAAAYTAPDNWIDESGTITYQISDRSRVSYPIRVNGQTLERDDKIEGQTNLVLSGRITGFPTFTVDGVTQPTAGNPNGSTKALWSGLVKHIDAGPNNLQGAGGQTWSLWGISDNDAAEVTAMSTLIGAYAASVSGLILKFADFKRLSARLIRVTFTESLTTTTDDVNFPVDDTYVDPNKLGNRATLSLVNSTPSVPEDMTERGVHSKPLPGGNTQNILDAGRRSTIADIENPESFKTTDATGVDVDQDITKVFDTGTPPSDPTPGTNQVIQDYVDQVIDMSKSKRTFHLRGVTKQQQQEFPRLSKKIDHASDPLTSEYFVAEMSAVTAFGVYVSTPSDPSPASGFKIIEVSDFPVPENAGFNVRVWRLGTKDSNDEAIFAKRQTATDPNAINTRQADAAVFSTGSPPSDPSVPSGLKLISKTDVTLTITYSLRVYEWGKRDSKDEVQFGSPNSSTRMGGSHSTFSPIRTSVTNSVTVESCNATDTAKTLAQARFISVGTSSTGNPAVIDVAAKKLTDTLAIYTTVIGPTTLMMEGRTFGGFERVTARYSGGHVQVWCADVVKRGSYDEVTITPQWVYRQRTRFTIARVLLTDSSGDFDQQFSYIGTSNNATFEGYGTNTVTYRGNRHKYNIELYNLLNGLSLSKQFPIPLVYNMEYRSDGIINEIGIVMGRFAVSTGTVTKNAWNNASLLGWTDAALASGADYSVFVT